MNLNNLFEAANPAQQAAIAISMKKSGKKPKSEDVAEEKVRLDPKCWTGKKIGNPKTKVKGGVRVNNCVPAESINEFAPPGGSDGDSGRWYTDDDLADIIGDDWFEDFDVSHDEFNIDTHGEKAKQNLASYANSWFDDRGYNVNVMGVEHNDVDHDLKWYIKGSFHNPRFADEGVAEGSPRVDSLVTDALKIMKGPEASDAVAALKTVLGDREYNGRRGHYNFYVRQLMDMSSQQGVAEAGYSNYDDNRTGFRRPPREDDEGHEQDRHREQQEKSGTWYIRLNGKLIKDKQGNPYSYRGKAAANKAALTMQAKLFNQGKEFMLTTNPNDKVAEASYINGKIEDPDSLRWKQTSMSYQEAVSKYGKDHVRMQSKSRLGDDIVEVLVPLGEDLSRRGFLRGLGAAALAGAAGMASADQQQDLGNGFVLTTIDVAGHKVKAVLDTERNISFTLNRGANGSAIIRSQARFLSVKDGKIVDTSMDVGSATKAAMKKAGLLPGLDESQQSGYGRGYASYKSSK